MKIEYDGVFEHEKDGMGGAVLYLDDVTAPYFYSATIEVFKCQYKTDKTKPYDIKMDRRSLLGQKVKVTIEVQEKK